MTNSDGDQPTEHAAFRESVVQVGDRRLYVVERRAVKFYGSQG